MIEPVANPASKYLRIEWRKIDGLDFRRDFGKSEFQAQEGDKIN